MDLLRSGYRKQEVATADPAIMLFGKQIKNLSTKDGEKIKEELSPRGVDEKGLSFATSSDEDEDLNPSVEVAHEDAMHVEQSASFDMGSVLGHTSKRKSGETNCVAQDGDAEKHKSSATECVTVRMGGDKHAGKQKGGIWSRCPRCNSADTKFCYFNNYNVNQPRHFCKHCQRYWTAGGTLRNVPIGAGKRKNKHVLHKHNFNGNSTSVLTVPTPILPAGVPNPDPLSFVKPDPFPTVKSDPLSIVKSNCVNTNLELSPHHSFTDSPTPSLSPCIESQASPRNPHSPHKLITLHPLHENLQSRFSQINHPHLATGYSKLSQIYPDLACGPSTLRPIHPELAGGCSKLSQVCPDLASGSPGFSQKSPLLQNGSYGASRICPHLHSGFSQICPEFARLGPHLGSGSSRLFYACPHEQSETSQECLDCRRNELSGLAKSETDFSDIKKGNLESELPISDQKNAGLERGLPDLAKTALEKANLQKKASFLQIGHPEIDPSEVHKYLQRCNEMKPTGCSGSNECKVHMRGERNELIEMKAPPMCLQGDYAQALGFMGKSEEAFNFENIMKRGVGEGHNGLPLGGALWPCFYNMFWLDPLAFSHFRPILTPQGWALPFIPPSATKLEPTSNSPHNSRAPPTCVFENFGSSGTFLTTSSTPTTLLATFEDVSNGTCSIATTTSLRKRSTEHASFEDHDGFDNFKIM